MMKPTYRTSRSLAALTAKLVVVSSAMALLVGCVTEPPPPPRPYRAYRQPPPPPQPNTDVYAYPLQNQTAEQQDRDRFECHEWGVKQTGFDPSAPNTPPNDRVRVVAGPPGPPPGTNTAIGVVTGAILGAAVARDSGAGAVVGAIAGGAIGSTADAANAANAGAQAQAIRVQDARQAAAVEQKASNYRRAISACLEGRGYSVK